MEKHVGRRGDGRLGDRGRRTGGGQTPGKRPGDDRDQQQGGHADLLPGTVSRILRGGPFSQASLCSQPHPRRRSSDSPPGHDRTSTNDYFAEADGQGKFDTLTALLDGQRILWVVVRVPTKRIGGVLCKAASAKITL